MVRNVKVNIREWSNQNICTNSNVSDYDRICTYPYIIANYWTSLSFATIFLSNSNSCCYIDILSYQSVKPDFNSDIEYMKDPLSRDIPSVDNSLFILARKLILES